MEDTELNIHVTSVLKSLEGGKRREQVLAWLAERRWHTGFGQRPVNEIDWREADKHALRSKR